MTRVWEEHSGHPLANVARLIQGVNAARAFKEIQADSTVHVREPDTDAAIGLLAPILDLDAVRKVGSKQKDDLAKTTSVARRLRTEIAPAQPDAALEGYIVARRREIAAEVGTALD